MVAVRLLLTITAVVAGLPFTVVESVLPITFVLTVVALANNGVKSTVLLTPLIVEVRLLPLISRALLVIMLVALPIPFTVLVSVFTALVNSLLEPAAIAGVRSTEPFTPLTLVVRVAPLSVVPTPLTDCVLEVFPFTSLVKVFPERLILLLVALDSNGDRSTVLLTPLILEVRLLPLISRALLVPAAIAGVRSAMLLVTPFTVEVSVVPDTPNTLVFIKSARLRLEV